MLKYLLSAKTKQNNPINNRQAFAASILRSLHHIYEKMFNYMNKHMYLPKMVSTPLFQWHRLWYIHMFIHVL